MFLEKSFTMRRLQKLSSPRPLVGRNLVMVILVELLDQLRIVLVISHASGHQARLTLYRAWNPENPSFKTYTSWGGASGATSLRVSAYT
jgi:hypothetical protein